MNELSKNANKLRHVLYKEYLKRIKNGSSYRDAIMIGGSDYIGKVLTNKWNKEDLNDICKELDRNKYVNCEYNDGSVSMLILLDNTIVYGQNRVSSGLKKSN